MKIKDPLSRLLVLLLMTLTLCMGMYWLPDTVFGFTLKRVDMLSDIRVKTQSASLDSLRQQLAVPDTLVVDSVALRDSMTLVAGIDSITLAVRDSLYRTLYGMPGADSLGSRIEDYTVGHVGLKRFFAALNGRKQLNRPVRVAFLGDSFIEGDILVGDFRSAMQQQFGGRGVGFVPIASVAASFRPTVELKQSGWKTWSMLTDHGHLYTLPGTLFEPSGDEASLSLKSSTRYPELPTASSLKFIYEQNPGAHIQIVPNGGKDTLREALPPTHEMAQYEQTGSFTQANITLTAAKGLQALGIAMEDNNGVVVDNFSLRGNSGIILERLDVARSQAFARIRPYDLIVIQYGLNVVSEDVLNYGWYTQRMVQVIRHLRLCFPEADILMLGVSDRSRQEEGSFQTMPAVLALLHAQRRAAKQAAIPFWNLFGAMGGENSMVDYVNKNWASKDYTHLSFRGGKEIANHLLKALLSEKEFYDEADKSVP